MSIPRLTEDITSELLKAFGVETSKSDEVSQIVEKAIVTTMRDTRNRCVDVVHGCCEEDQDLAHKIAHEIELKETALIANLSSLR